MDFNDNQKAGVGATLLSLAIWVWRRMSLAKKEDRPLINGQRTAFLTAIHTLQTENEGLRVRVIRLEAQADDGRREHTELHDRIEALELRLRRFGQHPAS